MDNQNSPENPVVDMNGFHQEREKRPDEVNFECMDVLIKVTGTYLIHLHADPGMTEKVLGFINQEPGIFLPKELNSVNLAMIADPDGDEFTMVTFALIESETIPEVTLLGSEKMDA